MLNEGSDFSQLSIELHPSYFAFAAKQKGQEYYQPVVLEHQTGHFPKNIQADQLSAWLKRYQAIWSHSYGVVNISIHGIPTTVVSTTNDAPAALELLTGCNGATGRLWTKKLQEDWQWAYSVDWPIDQLLSNYFVDANILPGIHGFTISLLSQGTGTLGLLLTPGMAQFICIMEDKATYYNCFQYQSKEDLLYFTLLCYKTLLLDPQTFPLTVGGLIEEDAPLYQTLYQFVKNISTFQPEGKISEATLKQAQLKPHYLTHLMIEKQ
jgi:hypothetical protein